MACGLSGVTKSAKSHWDACLPRGVGCVGAAPSPYPNSKCLYLFGFVLTAFSGSGSGSSGSSKTRMAW